MRAVELHVPVGQDLRAMSARGEILFSGDKFAPAGEGINPSAQRNRRRSARGVARMDDEWMDGRCVGRMPFGYGRIPAPAGLLLPRSPSPSIESSLSQSHSSLAPITLSFSNNLFIILSELDSILSCQGGRQMCSPLVACMLQFGIAV